MELLATENRRNDPELSGLAPILLENVEDILFD